MYFKRLVSVNVCATGLTRIYYNIPAMPSFLRLFVLQETQCLCVDNLIIEPDIHALLTGTGTASSSLLKKIGDSSRNIMGRKR